MEYDYHKSGDYTDRRLKIVKKKTKISADPSFLRPRAIQSQYFSNARTLFLCKK